MKKAASLQGSLSCDSESEATAKLDRFNTLPLSFGQGFETLQSVTQARKSWFFCACKKSISSGVVGNTKPFLGNTDSRSLAVSKHPIPHGIHSKKTKESMSMLKTTTKPQPIEKILQTIERQLHDLNRIERERERLAAGLSLTKGFKKALSKELAGHDKDLTQAVMEVLK